MIAVLPTYQKVEIGKLPTVSSTEGFALYIQLSASQVVAAVEVIAFKQFVFLQEFNFNKPVQQLQLVEVCKQIFSTKDVFNLTYSEVNIALDTNIDLLPSGFEQHVGTSEIVKLSKEIYAAYEVENTLKQFLKEKYEQAKIISGEAIFLKQVLPLPKGVYVEVRHESLTITILNAPNKLCLFNVFEYKTAEDFAYFLMLVCEELKVNREEVPLVFCGKIRKQSQIYSTCYRYFTDIVFLKPANGKFFAKAIDEATQSIYFSLFTM